ncbi:ATP-binding protein [Streptomyces sp. NPDC046853]|uniref:ATP-binding protein n=1 Tax=Streptomyces sp. NPDC046853 TaxID=3154920 RepID=UPI0033CDAA64
MSVAVPLNGGDSSIAEARHLAVDFLTRARADQDVHVSARAMDLTQLVVSELVTNACKYAPGPMLMELSIVDATVAVTVHDSAAARPVARSEDPLRIGGHGLEIVMAVAQNFDVHPEPAGKRITARIALSGEPGNAR